MRWFRISLVCALAFAAFLLTPSDDSSAIPTVAGGTTVFSVRDIGMGDITPLVNGAGLTCTAADLLVPPPTVPNIPCAARPAPVGAFPVPDSVTESFVDLGLDGPAGAAGAFIDELDALSFRERVGTGAVDFDFSVDTVPAQMGNTVGIPGCGAPPNVGTEAAAVGGPQAQGDVFTTAGLAMGCNVQFTDEAALGLVAPNVIAPNVCAVGARPCDDVDALADVVLPFGPGPCSVGGLPLVDSRCAAFSVSGASAILAGIPMAVGGFIADEGSILVPPGSLAVPPLLPAACMAWNLGTGTPCIAVAAFHLGLMPGPGAVVGDDLDALCWFDANGNMLPDLPNSVTPGVGDYYIFSLAPGSPQVVGPPFFSAADLLTTSGSGAPGMPVVVRTAASLGLLATDNVDALICHDNDTDTDGAPNLLDNCPMDANPNQLDVDSDGMGDACDTEGPAGNSNGLGGADDCTDGVDNDGDGATDALDLGCQVVAGDSDGDGFSDVDEGLIGTDPLDPCPDNTLDDAWPSDLDNNKVINISDVFYLLPPYYGASPPNPNYFARRDIVPDGVINISDVFKVLPPIFGSSCT